MGDDPAVEKEPGGARRLALLLHEGPVQVLSAAALRLELLGRRLEGPDAEEVMRAAEDVRAAVRDIERHTSAAEV